MKSFIVVILALFVSGCTSLPEHAVDQVKSVVLAKTTSSWDGAYLPAYPEGQPEITILKITVPPGVRLPLHYHPVINAGVMTAGELTVVTEKGQTNRLVAGDAIVEVVETLHYGMNEGRVPAEILVFYAGVKDGNITVINQSGDSYD
ncbi:MAG: cupin domain-containing protein [Kiritimatiellia bacterium]